MRLPPDDADDLEWLLFRQSGVVTWQQSSRLLSPGKVRHLVASGRWRRVCRGVLVTVTGDLTHRQRLWAAVLAAGPGAALAGLAAAREGGLRRVHCRREIVDVLVPSARRPADLPRRLPIEFPAVVVHRTSHLPERDRHRGLPDRTRLPRSVVDAARWAASDEEARVILAAACQQRLVLPEEVREATARLPKVRRRALIDQTATDIAGGAEALAEVDLRRLCRRFGLPLPVQQHRRRDAAGRVRYLDAYWPRWRLHAEVDGAHHTDAGQGEADLRRQNDIWIEGDRILRFPAFLVRRRPAEVADPIRRALLAAGWRDSPGR